MKFFKKSTLVHTILLVIGLVFSNCVKQPVADFSMDDSEYSPGDYIYFTNSSSDAKSYKWTFPDGTTSTSSNPSFYIPSYLPTGTHTIKLEAINGSKNDTREKTFSLIPSTGQLMFWTSYSSLGNITVNIDGNYAGTISGWYSSSPSCGATYGVTKDLSPGSHSFSATNGSKTWSGNYTVASGSCLKVQLMP